MCVNIETDFAYRYSMIFTIIIFFDASVRQVWHRSLPRSVQGSIFMAAQRTGHPETSRSTIWLGIAFFIVPSLIEQLYQQLKPTYFFDIYQIIPASYILQKISPTLLSVSKRKTFRMQYQYTFLPVQFVLLMSLLPVSQTGINEKIIYPPPTPNGNAC